jgi:Leucine-rich repeat (LRR) protein
MKAIYYSIFFLALTVSSCSSEGNTESSQESNDLGSSLTILDSVEVDTFDYNNCPRAWNLAEALAAPDSFCYVSLSDYENPITEIPPELEKVIHLRKLNLSYNKIAFLPDFLSKLTELNLFQNNLEEIPAGLENLTELTTLDLAHNKLTEVDPIILSLKKLETLSIGNNKLTSLPAEIFTLPNLRELSYIDNPLDEIPVEGLSQMKKLETLELSGLGLTDSSFSSGHNMKSVRVIYAGPIYVNSSQGDGNSLTTIPEWILEMDSLKNLYIDYGYIDSIPEGISRLTHLEELNLEGNSLKTIPKSISKMKHLRNLYLGGNDFSDEEIEKIKNWFGEEVNVEFEEMNVGC